MEMTRHELAELILKTMNAFEFIQFVDEGYENADGDARHIIEEFFRRRYSMPASDMTGILPLAQLKTTLSILLVTLCFASRIREEEWAQAGFSIRSEYAIRFERDGERTSDQGLNPVQVIATMRNASAHLPDIIEPNPRIAANVSFHDCCVSFASLNRGLQTCVTFCTQDGFVAFLRDHLRAVRRLVNEKLLGAGSGEPMPYIVN